MKEKSRTEYSAKNASVAMICKIIAIGMSYITRIIFTRTLSQSYVGVNGLFKDIIEVLALSELGFGVAITYALYKPIAEKDIERQKSLMRLFRNIYRIVAVFIATAGLAVVPFLSILVKDAQDVKHLNFIYLLYLLNSVLSYFFIYKKTLVDAHQLSYIGVFYQTLFLVLQNVFQIFILMFTGNFILYLLIHLFFTIISNLTVTKKAERLYPYLRDKEVVPLAREEKKRIFANMRAMMMHKLGGVVVNNTDNLLISSMVGIMSAGIYSNYYLIIGSLRQVLNQVFLGVTASIGNLGVSEDKGRMKKIFEAAFFAGYWLYGLVTICLFEFLNPFVEISFGKKYLFSREIVFVLCINFYITGMRQAVLAFRDSLGLFWHDRYKALVEAVINLVASIILVRYFGIIGVFVGTFISTVTTTLWVEPYVLYKKNLKAPVWSYFARYAIYTIVFFAVGALTDVLCSFGTGELWKILIWRMMISITVPNILFIICYHKIPEFHFLFEKGKRLFRKRS